MSRSLNALWLAPALLALAPGGAGAQFADADATVTKALEKLAAADKYPLKHDAERAKALRADRAKWHRAVTLDVFDRGPQAKAGWAPQARAVFNLYARRQAQIELSGSATAALDDLSDKLAREAVAAGCDDPLVRYLAEYRLVRGAKPDPKLAAKFLDTVTALDGSKYGDTCKVYAAHNWLSVAFALPPDDPLRKDVKKRVERFWELFEHVAADPHPAAGCVVFALAQQREDWDRTGPEPKTRRQNYEEIDKHLVSAKAPKAVRLIAEGRFLSREGWDARGTGLATTVTPEGRKIFRDRVSAAREKFEEAWAEDKTRQEAPTEMVKACKDSGAPRDEMETWFARAMGANPDNRWACMFKIEHLNPMWGGTVEGMAAFVWMCARSENVEGLIPMSVVDYQLSKSPIVGAGFDDRRPTVEAFYSKPAVWVSLDTALSALLKANPDDVYLRSLYARLACIASRNAVATAQFEKLGGKFDTRFFPTKGEFERFAEGAKPVLLDPEKLIGKWTAADDSLVEFGKTGAFKSTNPGGKETDGKYKLEGNRLTLSIDKVGDRSWTVTKLTAEALAFKNAGGLVLEFSRVKEK